MDNSNQMGNISRLERMNAPQLRQFFGTMHNDIASIESLYILLKADYFQESVLKNIQNEFKASRKKAATEKAIQQLNQDHPDLVQNVQQAGQRLNHMQRLAAPHRNEGFTWTNYFICIAAGALAYYSFQFAGAAYSTFTRLFYYAAGIALALYYVSLIISLCGHNYQNELSSAEYDADNVNDQYASLKKKYVDQAVQESWHQFLQEPANKKRWDAAVAQTEQANQMFGECCERLKNNMLVLPPKYRFNYAIEAFYDLVANGEATTWEHCTNVYMNQLQYKANQEKLDQISNQQKQQNDLIKNQNEALEGINQRIDNLNENVDQLNQSVNQMHNDMNRGFDQVTANQRREIFQNAFIGLLEINQMEKIRTEIARRPKHTNYYHIVAY